ncbi:DNA repair protein XRCC4-like [Ctenocephalides felis]|uniref:DNA repair protein XRCC4-like n=1 Tax=Ctenocephalides felis TaxID=7515 RepID=UPI000E6E5B4E|nr:DNA repair protein XRCC4-like [Ctenocephalides felis]
MTESQNEIHINKLPPKFIVRTEISEDDEYKIDVIENNKNWSGIFTTASMKQFAEGLGSSLEDYKSNVKYVLTTHDGVPYCTYSIEDKYFICRKEIKNTSMKSAVFKIKLEVNKNLSNINVIDDLIEQNTMLKMQLEHVNSQHKSLNETNAELILKVNKYRQLKIDMEEELYGKFLLLLNQKKEKIRELQNIINSTQSKERIEEIDENNSSSPLVISDSDHDDFMELNSQHCLDEISSTIPKFSTDVPSSSNAKRPRRLKSLKATPSTSTSSSYKNDHKNADELLDEFD